MYSINSDFVIKTGYAVLLAYVIVNYNMYNFTRMLANISQNHMILIYLITFGFAYMTIKVGKSEIFGDDKLPSFLFITLAVPFIMLSGRLLYDVMLISAFYVQTNF